MTKFSIPKLKNGPFHIKPRSFLARFSLVALLITPCSLLQPGAAKGALITPHLTISGQVEFDSSYAYASGAVTQSGTFSKTIGGLTTSSSFSGTTVSGPNPQANTLFDLGDGFGMSAETRAYYESEFALGYDIGMNIVNSSAYDYRITFKIEFDNHVDADGPDAYVGSEFTVDDAGGEVFFSDLISDTFFGDEIGGVFTGTFGDSLAESGPSFFDIIVNASSATNISSAWTLDGGVFANPGYAELDFSASITVDEIKNLTVPVPPTIYLFGTGIFGLLAAQMRKRKAEKA